MQELAARAERQYATIRDDEVRACWHVVVEALTRGWLDRRTLDELIHTLETGGGTGAEEYTMTVAHEYGQPDKVIVTLLDQEYLCPTDEMLHELRKLAGSNPVAEAQDVLRSLAALAGTPKESAVRAEAQSVLGRLDPAAAGVGLTDADRARLADALRAFADWAQRPEQGAKVDELIKSLDAGLGPLLTLGKQADEKATRDRIAGAARDSIARRLREAGAGGDDVNGRNG